MTKLETTPQAFSPTASARDRLIVALDYPDMPSALSLAHALGDAIHWYKVGMELYLSAGNAVVRALVDSGHSVFLDLKLHDIPNTVAGAVRSAAGSGASLLTIHAAGGPVMITAAAEAAASLSTKIKILAVTVLTSMDQQQMAATGIVASTADHVALLAAMAIRAGADGLVCSAEESATLRSSLGPKPLLVTPGIRPRGAPIGDQKRIATPAEALKSGASYLVVGRPITQTADPRAAAESILAEMQAAII